MAEIANWYVSRHRSRPCPTLVLSHAMTMAAVETKALPAASRRWSAIQSMLSKPKPRKRPDDPGRGGAQHIAGPLAANTDGTLE
jgi:hypothetical protein